MIRLRTPIKHTGIYLLTALLFVATTGVSFHQLYCYCQGKAVASIFKPDDPCHLADAGADDACCDGQSCNTGLPEQNKDCSNCYTQYINLDSEFIVGSFDLKLNVPAAVVSLTRLVIRKPANIKPVLRMHDIPPPSGTALRILFQSFLC